MMHGDRLAHFKDLLQRRPGLRFLTYIAGNALIVETGYRVATALAHERRTVFSYLLPFGVPFAYVMAKLKHEDIERWTVTPTNLRDLATGVVWGSAAIGSLIGVAAKRGWYTLPGWGAERWGSAAVLRSMLTWAAEFTESVWYEETMFRGYGYTTLRAAIGDVAATVLMVSAFTVWHGFDRKRIQTYSLMSIAFFLLRSERDDIWLSYGFHWGWNVVQTAVFGGDDAYVSLRPVTVSSEDGWVGAPGSTQPSRLANIWLAALCVIFGVRLWLKRRARASA